MGDVSLQSSDHNIHMWDFIASKLQVGWHQVFNQKVYTTRLCNEKEYLVRYWSKFWYILHFDHNLFVIIDSYEVQQLNIQWWNNGAKAHTLSCENVSSDWWHMPLKMLLHLLQKLIMVKKWKSNLPKFNQHTQWHMKVVEAIQKERDKHFIINEKGYLLHSDFRQLHSFVEIERRNSLSCT